MQDLLICHNGCIHTVHVWQSSGCPAYLLFSQQASKPDLQHGQSHILQDAACLNAIRQLTCSLVCPERMSAGNLQSAKLIRCGLEAEDAMLALLHEIILPWKRTIFLSLQMWSPLLLFFKSAGCYEVLWRDTNLSLSITAKICCPVRKPPIRFTLLMLGGD